MSGSKMMNKRKTKRGMASRSGMTLVEVLVAVLLVVSAAALVYQGGFYSYRTLMRSRFRLEAQGIAFDTLWALLHTPYQDLPSTAQIGERPTPAGGLLSTNGLVRFRVAPETNPPLSQIDYWEITVQVWAPSNHVLFAIMNPDGTVRATDPAPLAEYTVLRYRGER